VICEVRVSPLGAQEPNEEFDINQLSAAGLDRQDGEMAEFAQVSCEADETGQFLFQQGRDAIPNLAVCMPELLPAFLVLIRSGGPA
jgi:hypothetical protein